ncbi:unnamed protein product, partial [Protopolystoma xenopodis]
PSDSKRQKLTQSSSPPTRQSSSQWQNTADGWHREENSFAFIDPLTDSDWHAIRDFYQIQDATSDQVEFSSSSVLSATTFKIKE